VVIEFAVVGDPARTILVRHGLGTSRGQIDYGKPAMAKTEVTVDVKSFGVRPAMSQGSGHAHQEVAINRPLWFSVVKDAGDAAHTNYFLASINKPVAFQRLSRPASGDTDT
jgi:hypothetical protein